MIKKLINIIFLSAAILLNGCSNNSENQIKKVYYADGKLRSEVPIINGKENGILTYYYENGEVKSQISLKEGINDGYCYYFYPDKVLKAIAYYNKDTLDRDFVKYDEKGRIVSITKYFQKKLRSFITFDSLGNIIKGTPMLAIGVTKDTIKLGETYSADIRANYADPRYSCDIYLRIDSNKKEDIYTKIGDNKQALYKITPKELGEHNYEIRSLQVITNENDSAIGTIERFFNGKYWVVK